MTSGEDPYDLRRFVVAQDRVYASVLDELRRGEKRGHWMWFVFPQVKGLGSSATSQAFGIASWAESRAYAAHPVLGARLRECTRLVLGVEGRSIEDILGHPDDLKFRSSMTLFERAVDDPALFTEALRKYCGGLPDPATLRILQAAGA
jgi:uncharacterized protein (DUF1810 family)